MSTAITAIRTRLPKSVTEVRKFLIVAVPVFGLDVGTSSPLYIKVVAVLVALGVYAVKNVPSA